MASNWFVAWVATGRERELLERIRRVEGIEEALAPEAELWKRRSGVWGKEKQLLFPGYIFVKCEMGSPIYYALRELPGLIGWLGKDAQWPSTVSADEMDRVLRIAAGIDPREVLEELEINLRQRRGYGTIRIKDQAYRVPFNTYDDKQADEPAGDASPTEEEAE